MIHLLGNMFCMCRMHVDGGWGGGNFSQDKGCDLCLQFPRRILIMTDQNLRPKGKKMWYLVVIKGYTLSEIYPLCVGEGVIVAPKRIHFVSKNPLGITMTT